MQLNNLGLSELSQDEMQQIDGGIIPALIIGGILLMWSTAAH